MSAQLEEIIRSISAYAPTMMIALIDLSLKGSIILSAAGLAALAVRGLSASHRHLIWSTALAALILLPLLGLILPAWQTPLIPAGLFIDVPEQGNVEVTGSMISLDAERLQKASSDTFVFPEVHWTFWPVALWMLGASGIAVWLLVGKLKARMMLRTASILNVEPIRRKAKEIADRLGFDHNWQLMISNRIKIPLAVGSFSHTILLPSDALDWSEEKLGPLLTHEMIHIKRRDILFQWPAMLANALYWFNPLVWLAGHQQLVERELACDDQVLNTGVKPSVYADYLLEAAGRLTAANSHRWATSGMARGGDFKMRMKALLNGEIDRKNVTLKATIITVVIAALLAGVAAAWSPWAPAVQEKEVPAAPVKKEAAEIPVPQEIENAKPQNIPMPSTPKEDQNVPAASLAEKLERPQQQPVEPATVDNPEPEQPVADIPTILIHQPQTSPPSDEADVLQPQETTGKAIESPTPEQPLADNPSTFTPLQQTSVPAHGKIQLQEQEEPLEVAGAIRKPEVTFPPTQPFPNKAKILRRSGSVRVRLIIRKDGSHEVAEILSETPPDFGFGEAARKYLAGSTWKPATLDGTPVDVYYEVTISFGFGPMMPAMPNIQEKEDEPPTLAEDITKPIIRWKGPQPYPQKAKSEGVSGWVRLKLIIYNTGKYEVVKVIEEKPEGCGFADAAKIYLEQSEMTPAMREGKPLTVYYEITVSFKLKEETQEKTKKQDTAPEKIFTTGAEGELPEPEVIHRVEPEFPAKATAARKTGSVVVEAVVGKDGLVEKVEVVKSSIPGYGFEESAIAAVKQWKFKPATLDGKPVKVVIKFSVDFNLFK